MHYVQIILIISFVYKKIIDLTFSLHSLIVKSLDEKWWSNLTINEKNLNVDQI